MPISTIEKADLKKNAQLIESSHLLIIAFATAFGSRFLESFGAPSPINFLHLVMVPLVCGIVLTKSKVKSRNQVNICYALLSGLLFFLAIEFASAVLNNAGFINIVFDMLLLTEPFLLLLIVVSLPLTVKMFKRLRFWFEGFVFFHLFLIYVQKVVLGYCSRPGDCDNVQGIFYHSGSGHVVGASVSASFAFYYFVVAKERRLWVRSLVFIAGLGNIITSDAKQVLLTILVGVAVLALTKRDLAKSISYLTGFILFVIFFSWAIQNIEALSAFNTWVRPEIYGADGEATKLKLSGIRIALTHFHSPLNWLVGLGPGHTIDRLGGWMLRDYGNLLMPLGATKTTVGPETWRYVASSWLAEGSSMFAPFWGWAAIWADLGFLGLATYLYLAAVVWIRLCLDDVSRLLMLTVMTHGFIFTQLEEPSYMLSIAMMVGILWQENRLRADLRKSEQMGLEQDRRLPLLPSVPTVTD